MLREWVHTVGVAAGLDPTHVSLLTGAIGSPESSVEMEIAGFGNMAGEFLFIFVVWAIRVTSVVFCSLQRLTPFSTRFRVPSTVSGGNDSPRTSWTARPSGASSASFPSTCRRPTRAAASANRERPRQRRTEPNSSLPTRMKIQCRRRIQWRRLYGRHWRVGSRCRRRSLHGRLEDRAGYSSTAWMCSRRMHSGTRVPPEGWCFRHRMMMRMRMRMRE